MDAGCHHHCHVEQLVAVEGQVKLPGEEALREAAGIESGTKLQQVDQLSKNWNGGLAEVQICTAYQSTLNRQGDTSSTRPNSVVAMFQDSASCSTPPLASLL